MTADALRFAPDPKADGLSNVDYAATLPHRRYGHMAKGQLLFLPMSGYVVVPFEMTKGGWWNVVVVVGSGPNAPGGYNLTVGPEEIETAIGLTALLESAADGAPLSSFDGQIMDGQGQASLLSALMSAVDSAKTARS